MKAFVEVISPGLHSSIQDKGRFGFRKYGVPISGSMDEQSAALANHLLNNASDSAVLEITLHGPKLVFSASTSIAISGADLSPKLNKDLIPINKVIAVKKDDVLSFGTPKFGSRCYLAVKGGFQTEFIMNSYAYYGSITNSNTIRKGEKLPIQSVNIASDHFTSVKINSEFFTSQDLECTTGPEYDLLGARDRELIFKTNFTVTKDNNRMGYRLESPPIPYPQAYNMLTSSVLPGTVQLTPSGKLIVLMKDCQTTGGYPRVLQLTGNGINRLAQKKANDIISFQLLT